MVPESLSTIETRDARIASLLAVHPVTAALLLSLGWFPSMKRAQHCLRRLTRHKRVKMVGMVQRGVTRPVHVYCRWRPRKDRLRQELELTEVCLQLQADGIVRDPLLLDRTLRPAAEITINGLRYFVELDCSVGYAAILRRLRRYRACPHPLLWLCGSRERREVIRQGATGFQTTALFTTMAEAMANPHGAIWRTVEGNTVPLPRGATNCAARRLAARQGSPAFPVPAWLSRGLANRP